MTWVALKMMTGNRGKYFAIVFGIAFACMLMGQQASIFCGLMRNTTSQIRDTTGADIWVMDPSVEFVDDVTPLADNDLFRVRGVPGVSWAVRFYKGLAGPSFWRGTSSSSSCWVSTTKTSSAPRRRCCWDRSKICGGPMP